MLNNLTNFFNLIRGRKIKTTLADSDLIAIGVRDSRFDGNYQPSAIKYEDLKSQVIRPYKSYTVSLSQCGSNPSDVPVIEVEFENTLEVQATYSRVGGGEYIITFDKLLFSSKHDYTIIYQGVYNDNFNFINSVVDAYPIYFNAVAITSINAGTVSDCIIGQYTNNPPCILEVRVYNQ